MGAGDYWGLGGIGGFGQGWWGGTSTRGLIDDIEDVNNGIGWAGRARGGGGVSCCYLSSLRLLPPCMLSSFCAAYKHFTIIHPFIGTWFISSVFTCSSDRSTVIVTKSKRHMIGASLRKAVLCWLRFVL